MPYAQYVSNLPTCPDRQARTVMTRKEWQPDQQQSREEGPQQHATPQSGLIALKTPTDDACITEVMSVSEGILSVRWDHSDEKKNGPLSWREAETNFKIFSESCCLWEAFPSSERKH